MRWWASCASACVPVIAVEVVDRGLPRRPSSPTRRLPVPQSDKYAPLPAQIRQVRAGKAFRRLHAPVLAYSSPSCSPDPPPSGRHLAVLATPPLLSGPLATLPGTARIGLSSASPACCEKDGGGGLSTLTRTISASRAPGGIPESDCLAPAGAPSHGWAGRSVRWSTTRAARAGSGSGCRSRWTWRDGRRARGGRCAAV
jgi:hypothetical protein